MEPHSSFDALARLIERLDADGRSVCRAEAATATDEEGSLRATLEVSVAASTEVDAEPALEPTTASVDDGLSVTLRSPAFPDPAAVLPDGYPPVSATVSDVRVEDGSAVVTLAVTIESAEADPDQPGDRSSTAEPASGVDGTASDTACEREGSPDAGSERTGLASARNGDERATAAFGTGPRDAATDATSAGEASGVETDDDGVDQTDPSNDEVARESPDNGEAESDESRAETPDGTSDETAASLATVRDESVPPYEDTAYLEALYERCGTFAEMSERIEMDVSAETVRRYMIDAEVHSPASYETAGQRRTARSSDSAAEASDDDDPEATELSSAADGDRAASERSADGAVDPLPDEQLVADGIGLPEELTLHDVVDAVVGARTVREVQREIGLEYDRTRHLLTQLNVLDLVVGRVAEGGDRDVSVDAVTARIRQCTPDGA